MFLLELVLFACSRFTYATSAARQRLSARARDKYHVMPASAVRARTAASETAVETESAVEANQSQPNIPTSDNRTPQKMADQTREMFHLNSVTCGVRLCVSDARIREWETW
jgi:hypothetical protein